eukprot:NODE_5912_length_480_cov_200.953596_g4443_i0.p1 GENE.NODE_5912_length_480_cov_200.953596_g4443_i0~~NODE_5912_length_480_cov_200.953596_g4443_i0.p1  ORF type:complete len:147 (+),score=53.75 NODE_5912_length_480_cov_200.953596_g4443_i0:32-442(+)
MGGLGDVLFPLLGPGLLADMVQNGYADPEKHREKIEADKAHLAAISRDHPGFPRSLLSTTRYFPFGGLAGMYKALGKLKLDILIVWGDQDRITPVREAGTLAALLPGSRLLTLLGVGHNVVDTESWLPDLLSASKQ